MTLLDADRRTWWPVVARHRLVPGRGVAALVDGRAVAVFRLDDEIVLAIDDVDPATGASVLSRGLVGRTTIDGRSVHYVASPLRKHRYDLVTGREVGGDREVATFDVRIVDGVVEVASPAGATEPSHRSNASETGP